MAIYIKLISKKVKCLYCGGEFIPANREGVFKVAPVFANTFCSEKCMKDFQVEVGGVFDLENGVLTPFEKESLNKNTDA